MSLVVDVRCRRALVLALVVLVAACGTGPTPTSDREEATTSSITGTAGTREVSQLGRGAWNTRVTDGGGVILNVVLDRNESCASAGTFHGNPGAVVVVVELFGATVVAPGTYAVDTNHTVGGFVATQADLQSAVIGATRGTIKIESSAGDVLRGRIDFTLETGSVSGAFVADKCNFTVKH
jgi:hypothetical protein